MHGRDQLVLDGFRRIKTHAPVTLLPRLILTQHLFTSLAQARRRLADSHRLQMHLLGGIPMEETDGNIVMRGDTTIHHHGVTWRGAACGLVAAGALAGAAWWASLSWPHLRAASRPPTPATSDRSADERDWRLGLVVTDRP